jgi:ribosomal protein S10
MTSIQTSKKSSKLIKISFKFKSFHNYNLKLILPKILKKVTSLTNYKINFVSLPTKIERFTVLRSPHVDKKSREQFELRKYTKILNLYFDFSNNFEKQKAKLLINFIKNSSAGLSLKISYEI